MERLRTLLEGKETSHILPFLWMKGEDNGTIAGELDRIEEWRIREMPGVQAAPGFLRSGLVGEPGFYLQGSKKKGNEAVDSG